MKSSRSATFYNVIFPVWLLIWIPSWLWLILIPVNYLIDRLVLLWSLKGQEDRNVFCRAHTWKICLAGFFSDFVGAALLLGIVELTDRLGGYPARDSFGFPVMQGIMLDPFSNPFSLLIVLAAVALAGLLIFLLDRWILTRAGLERAQAKASALKLALITAPYLFLLPIRWFYV